MTQAERTVEINWMIGWSNAPDIAVHDAEDHQYLYHEYKIGKTGRNISLFIGFTADKVFADYLLKDWDSSNEGAIGKTITLDDGRVLDLSGCWSSRTSVANIVLPEEDHITECDLKGSYRYHRVAISIAWLRGHLPEGVGLRKFIRNDGEIKYEAYPIKGSAIFAELQRKKPELCTGTWIKRA